MDITIVSGGQTGVDRGALDAALALGADCGGWCPEGRLAEDGIVPSRYPLQELHRGGYAERTRRNVECSDATLVVRFPDPGAGTELTIRHARRIGRPLLVIDADSEPAADAARTVLEFLHRHDARTLNVAGPRASGAPLAHAYAADLIRRLLESA